MTALDGGMIVKLLDRLIEGGEVYAPVLEGGHAAFRRISSGSEALLDYTNSRVPPKHVLMPMTQTLLTSAGDGRAAVEHVAPGGPAVLFGVRPCDARAIAFLDRVFGTGERDCYYMARREALTIVSLACTEPRAACFCETTGGGPSSTEGSDILLEPCGGGWLARVVTERGRVFAEEHGLRVAGGEAGGADDEGNGPRRASIEPGIDPTVLKRNLDHAFDDPRWGALAEKCIGCGACAFLCPACHCFDIVDGEDGGVRHRRRIWDSCQFPSFTAQASGFNPRPSGAERFRQRLMHKFGYCPENYGVPGCTGCGRCVEACPVNLDIRLLMRAFHDGMADR